jgi:hypothetical protein
MDDVGTSENLRVDVSELRRVAAAVDDLLTGTDEAEVLVTGLARLRRDAPTSASTAATAQVIEATRTRVAHIAATTTAFADGLRTAGQGYVRADAFRPWEIGVPGQDQSEA